MGVGFIIVMGMFIKCCAVHTPSSNPKKAPHIRIGDTLRRPISTLRRHVSQLFVIHKFITICLWNSGSNDIYSIRSVTRTVRNTGRPTRAHRAGHRVELHRLTLRSQGRVLLLPKSPPPPATAHRAAASQDPLDLPMASVRDGDPTEIETEVIIINYVA
jgi:hypothetical protein